MRHDIRSDDARSQGDAPAVPAREPRTPAPPVEELPDGATVTLVLRVLTAAAFVVILNETLMVNALPPLMEVFGITAATGQWLTTGFMLTMAVVIPMTGWLLQRVSIRTAFAIAMGTFVTGTLACALAPTFPVLLGGRVVQAVGTAIMMPLLMTTIMRMVEPSRRGRVMGNLTLAISVAPAMGPAVSGLILQWTSWRWLFGFVLPIAAVMFVVGYRGLKGTRPGRPSDLDLISVVLTAVGFGGVVYGLSAFGKGDSGEVDPVLALVVGAVALALFVTRQLLLQRRGTPFLDLRVLTIARYLAPFGVLSLGFMTMIGTMLLLPIALQQVRGMSTLESGLMLLPGGIAMGLLGPTVGRLFDRWGPRPLVIPGALTVLLALAGMALAVQSAPWWVILLLHASMSLGMACVFTPSFTSGLGSLPAWLYSHGSALLGAAQQVAAAAGAAFVVTVMELRAATLRDEGADTVDALGQGISAGIWCGAGIGILLVVLATLVRRPPADPDRSDPGQTDDDRRDASAPGQRQTG